MRYTFIYTVGINTLDGNVLNTAVSSTNILLTKRSNIGKYYSIALKLSLNINLLLSMIDTDNFVRKVYPFRVFILKV